MFILFFLIIFWMESVSVPDLNRLVIGVGIVYQYYSV